MIKLILYYYLKLRVSLSSLLILYNNKTYYLYLASNLFYYI